MPHTAAALTGHTRAVGVDWGLNTLLCGSVADLQPDGRVTTDGRPLRFDATGVSAKLVRLRRQREHLHPKLDDLTRLRDGRGGTADPALAERSPNWTGSMPRSVPGSGT